MQSQQPAQRRASATVTTPRDNVRKLLRRPDWALLLPATPEPRDVAELEELIDGELQGVELAAYRYCIICAHADGTRISDSVCSDDEDEDGDDAYAELNAQGERVCRRCKEGFSDQEWLDRLAEDLVVDHLPWGEYRSVCDYDGYHAWIFPILLERFQNRALDGVAHADRAATSAYNAAHAPPAHLLEHPFAAEGLWKVPSNVVRLSDLRLSLLKYAHSLLDDLTVLVTGMGTLRSLSLGQTDIWSGRSDDFSLRAIQRFAAGVGESNLEELCLGSFVDDDSADVAPPGDVVANVSTFFEHLDTPSLRTLELNDLPVPRGTPASARLDLAAARFLRRSVRTSCGYAHPAHALDPQRIGAPNLRAFFFRQREGRDIAILGAALTGSAPPAAPAHADADGTRDARALACALPPVRSVMASDFAEGLEVDDPRHCVSDTCDTRISLQAALYVFDPRCNPHPPPDVFASCSESSAALADASAREIKSAAAPSEALMQAARAQARRFVRDVAQLTLDSAARRLVARHACNFRANEARELAAFAVLKAARVLACQVTGTARARRPAPWLALPAELRMMVLGACDEHQLLSDKQRSAAIAFAADRRTLGFGRLNEITLFPHRRHLERELEDECQAEAERLDAPGRARAHALEMVPVRWSWAASLRHALPADWALHFICDHGDFPTPRQREGAAAAFLAVTGCRTPLCDRDLPDMPAATAREEETKGEGGAMITEN